MASENHSQRLLHYWLTGDRVLVEWCVEGWSPERSTYEMPWYGSDVALIDGEPCVDLEDSIYDIVTRTETANIARLCAGKIANAPALLSAVA